MSRSSPHDVSWSKGLPSLPQTILSLTPSLMSSEFPGWESSFWPPLTFSTQSKSTDQPLPHSSVQQGPGTATSWMCRQQDSAPGSVTSSRVGWTVGRSQVCVTKQGCRERAGGRHSTQHKQPVSGGNLSSKWTGNESLEWGVGFSPSSCCLLFGLQHAAFRHFRNEDTCVCASRQRLNKNVEMTHFYIFWSPHIRGIWQWPRNWYELHSLIPC